VAERAKTKVVWTASSYFGEGLPWSFMHQMATEYLTAIKAPLEQVGYTSLLHLGTTFKFVWSPIVDLVSTKRGWLVLMQVCLGLAMMGVAAVAPGGDLLQFWAVLALMSVLSAAHDIACDGFYMLALDRKDQALYSGVRVAAFRGAMIVGSSGLVVLAGRYSWRLGFGVAGLAMLVLAGLNFWLLPRPAERVREQAAPASASAGLWERVLRSEFLAAYRSFLGQPSAVTVLAFMLFYKLGDIMMFAMSKPLLRDLGISTEQRGVINGFGTAMTIGGSILGGALIAKGGLERWLIPMTFFQNLAIPLYIGMAVFQPGYGGVFSIVLFEQLAAGIGSAAHVCFLMQRCRSTFSASHYAFATAIVGLSSTISGALSGHLDKALGHPLFFTVAFVCSWPALLLVLVVPRAPLEAATIAKEAR
jgi:PAT family beta-lactamase induction signal transducer AmpG